MIILNDLGDSIWQNVVLAVCFIIGYCVFPMDCLIAEMCQANKLDLTWEPNVILALAHRSWQTNTNMLLSESSRSAIIISQHSALPLECWHSTVGCPGGKDSSSLLLPSTGAKNISALSTNVFCQDAMWANVSAVKHSVPHSSRRALTVLPTPSPLSYVLLNDAFCQICKKKKKKEMLLSSCYVFVEACYSG